MNVSFRQLGLFALTVWYEIVGSRILLAAGVLFAITIMLMFFLGEVAVIEKNQIQAGFLGAMLRLMVVFLVSLFTISSIHRERNDKVLLLFFSLPVERSIFVLGKFIGFACLPLLLVAAAAVVTGLVAETQAVLAWSLTLLLESWLIVGFSMLCAFSMHQLPSAVMTVAGIYLASRSMNTILLLASDPLNLQPGTPGQQFLQGLLRLLDYLLPRLDLFARSEWLIYGQVDIAEITGIVLQSLVYLIFILAAAFLDFQRKSF